MLELTTQSRKRKIKDDNNFSEFYKPSKKRKTEEEDEDIEYEAILNSHWFLQKRENPALPMEYEIRNGGKTSTGGGQEKTLKRISKLKEQHLASM